MYKKLLPILTAAFCLFFFSCSNSMFMNYMNYNQKPGSSTEDDKKDDEVNDDSIASSIKISSAFAYILPDGKIDPACPPEIATALKNKFAPIIASVSSEELSNRLFEITSIDDEQIPTMNLSKIGVWSIQDVNSSKNESKYHGKDFDAKGFTNTNVWYYRYQKLNPFFASQSNNNLFQYKVDSTFESVLSRFIFYRWTAVNMGQILNTYMIALDTYTGLIWSYAKITEYNEIVGNEVPTKYEPVDIFVAEDNKTHQFYEYDPAGQVNADGSIELFEWYKLLTKEPLNVQKRTPPPLGGKHSTLPCNIASPYYNDGTDEMDAVVQEQEGYTVTGTIGVSLNYLKNLTNEAKSPVTGKSLDAKFYWNITISGYSGDQSEAPEANLLALKEKNDRVTLDKGSSYQFNEAKTSFTFEKETRPLTLEINNGVNFQGDYIIEGAAGLGAFSYNVVFLYDRLTQRWISEDKKYSIGIGESVNISVYDTTRAVETNYTITWDTTPKTEKGSVLNPVLKKTGSGSQVTLGNEGMSFSLEYTDADIGSVNEHKMIELDLLLHNLKTDAQPVDIFLPTTNSNNLINNARLNGTTLVKRGGTYGTASIPVTFTLLKNGQGAEREASIVIRLLYPSSGYDTQYSPKEITLNVKRKQQKSE